MKILTFGSSFLVFSVLGKISSMYCNAHKSANTGFLFEQFYAL